MSKISNIKFVDASYFLDYEDKLPEKLSVYEAYGYAEESNESVTVSFIEPLSDKQTKIIKGLIIPRSALLSYKNKTKILNSGITKGVMVSVTWSDVVYVANTQRNTHSSMYTEGVLEEIAEDFLILMDPETIRFSPLPIVNHPKVKPARYMIPLSIIQKIEPQKQNEKK